MAFVKLDSGILKSTLWLDRDLRDVFITSLLLAEPFESIREIPQLEVRSFEPTGWTAPPGWYGLVDAAGVGIARQAGIDADKALDALERLGRPEPESRSQDFDGRRMIRIDGGYIVLNYFKFRDRDHRAKDRMRRLRARRKGRIVTPNVTVTKANGPVTTPNVTHSREHMHTHREELTSTLLLPTQILDSPPNVRGRAKRATALDPEFGLTADQERYATERLPNVDLPELLASFRDHHSAKGTVAKDWPATWRTWVRRALTYGYPVVRPTVEGSAPSVRFDANGRRIN